MARTDTWALASLNLQPNLTATSLQGQGPLDSWRMPTARGYQGCQDRGNFLLSEERGGHPGCDPAGSLGNKQDEGSSEASWGTPHVSAAGARMSPARWIPAAVGAEDRSKLWPYEDPFPPQCCWVANLK